MSRSAELKKGGVYDELSVRATGKAALRGGSVFCGGGGRAFYAGSGQRGAGIGVTGSFAWGQAQPVRYRGRLRVQ